MKKNCFRLSYTVLLIALCFACVSCAETRRKADYFLENDIASFDLASQPTFYDNSFVSRSAPHVQVYPTTVPAKAPSVLMVPLRITQQMHMPVEAGRALSRQVWQGLLQGRAFTTLDYMETVPPYNAQTALAVARARGATLVVGGYITYYMDGGTVGDSMFAMQIEIYHVPSQTMIWSVAHSGIMQSQAVSDYLIFAVKSRLPADPPAAIVQAVSMDIAQIMRNWQVPPLPEDAAEKPSF